MSNFSVFVATTQDCIAKLLVDEIPIWWKTAGEQQRECCVAMRENMATVEAWVEARRPDIVVLNGLAATECIPRVRARSPGSRLLVVTQFEGPVVGPLMLQLGACAVVGYEVPGMRFDNLIVEAMKACLDDRPFVEVDPLFRPRPAGCKPS